MAVIVSVQIVQPRKLAAVRRRVAIGAAWRPALDGHSVFLYHHPARRGDPMDVDFGSK